MSPLSYRFSLTSNLGGRIIRCAVNLEGDTLEEPKAIVSGDSKEAVAFALLYSHLYQLPPEERKEIRRDSHRFQNLYVDFLDTADGIRPQADQE